MILQSYRTSGVPPVSLARNATLANLACTCTFSRAAWSASKPTSGVESVSTAGVDADRKPSAARTTLVDTAPRLPMSFRCQLHVRNIVCYQNNRLVEGATRSKSLYRHGLDSASW